MGTSGGPYIVRDSNLVLELDAADKNSYSGSGTAWNDLVRSGNSGSLTNGPIFDSANGGIIVLDGINDYVNLTGSAINYSPGTTGELSLEVWVYPVGPYTSYVVEPPTTNIGAIFGQSYLNNSIGWGLSAVTINNTANHFTFQVRSGSIISAVPTSSITSFTNDSKWYHIVGSFTRNDLTRLYVDGVLAASASSTALNGITITPNLFDGAIGRGGGNLGFVSGLKIANARVYSKPLSAIEVLQNYNELKSRFENITSIVTSGSVLNLDAGNSNSYPGTGTTWTDLSGNGNNGTLVNSPTYNSTSGSFTFNGSTQYATTPSQIINVTSSWTTNVWFKTTGSTNIPSLVVRGNVSETLIWACYLQNATGRVQFLMRNSTDQVITGTTSTNDNNWHMATYTNTGGLVRVYLDGNQENSGSITNLSNIANNVVLGRWGDSTGPYYYRGHIGTVQMYNRALSSTEILRNYNTQKSRFGL